MTNGFSSLLRTPTFDVANPDHTAPSLATAKPLDTAPVLIIENPLPSYYELNTLELELGSKTVPGVKFSSSRLKHVESIDAIFTANDQVNFDMSFSPVFLPLNSIVSRVLQLTPQFIEYILFTRVILLAPSTVLTITYLVPTTMSIVAMFEAYRKSCAAPLKLMSSSQVKTTPVPTVLSSTSFPPK
jgi:hypothetical protein